MSEAHTSNRRKSGLSKGRTGGEENAERLRGELSDTLELQLRADHVEVGAPLRAPGRVDSRVGRAYALT